MKVSMSTTFASIATGCFGLAFALAWQRLLAVSEDGVIPCMLIFGGFTILSLIWLSVSIFKED